MTRVDFYILDAPGEIVRQKFACRLAEKAYRMHNTVHIQTGSRQVAEQLDELLWTFRDGSFVPHQIADGSAADAESPVTIGFERREPGNCDLLINLTDSVPENPGSFPRVAEIVTSDEQALSLSRERFATYRDQGHSLDTHKL
jgi:DNA polymerase-3 subunit chi